MRFGVIITRLNPEYPLATSFAYQMFAKTFSAVRKNFNGNDVIWSYRYLPKVHENKVHKQQQQQ